MGSSRTPFPPERSWIPPNRCPQACSPLLFVEGCGQDVGDSSDFGILRIAGGVGEVAPLHRSHAVHDFLLHFAKASAFAKLGLPRPC